MVFLVYFPKHAISTWWMLKHWRVNIFSEESEIRGCTLNFNEATTHDFDTLKIECSASFKILIFETKSWKILQEDPNMQSSMPHFDTVYKIMTIQSFLTTWFLLKKHKYWCLNLMLCTLLNSRCAHYEILFWCLCKEQVWTSVQLPFHYRIFLSIYVPLNILEQTFVILV